MLPWQKGSINKGWAVCIKVLKSCMESKYWNYVGCIDHRDKQRSYSWKPEMYETKQASVQNAWDIQSFRVLGSSCSAQGFFDLLQIVFYSDLPVSYNCNLEAIQSTCIFFCLFLNPAHVPEKMIAQKYTNGDRPHHTLWRWSYVWLLPSQAKCCVISPFAQTKWYQPCPVGQFTEPAGILHIALFTSKSSFSTQGSPDSGRGSLPILTLMCHHHWPGWAPGAGTRSQVMQQRHTHWKPRMAPMYLVAENNSIPGRNWPLKVSQKGTATL